MKSDNYPSPKWILNLFEDWFDPCPLDPSPKVDGLAINWKKKTYVNPPYSNPLPWVHKAIEESLKGNMVAMLLKADVSTELFRLCMQKGKVFYFSGRLKFGNTNRAPFPSMLVIFSPKGGPQWEH